MRSDVKMREFMHAGISYEIDMDVMTEEIKAGLDELCRRPLYRKLMELHAFDVVVVISGAGECRRYEVEYL